MIDNVTVVILKHIKLQVHFDLSMKIFTVVNLDILTTTAFVAWFRRTLVTLFAMSDV